MNLSKNKGGRWQRESVRKEGSFYLSILELSSRF